MSKPNIDMPPLDTVRKWGNAVMKIRRVGLCALVLSVATPMLVACSGPAAPTADNQGGNATSSPSTSSPSSTSTSLPNSTSTSTSRGSDPTEKASDEPPAPNAPSKTPAPTSKDQPVPKVQRSQGPDRPTETAKPTTVDKPVRYGDGLAMRVVSVSFDKETKKGPGSFPGRAYAVLTLEVANKSSKALSMNTVVITVLDKSDVAVAPVYASEAKVQDFSGSLKAGKTQRARYAFAVPKSSRSKVTVVADLDGAHTSAVFRGKLS